MESPHGREEKRPVKKKSKKVVKGAASHKAVDSAIATINDVAASATKAVIAVDKEYKKLSKTGRRIWPKHYNIVRSKILKIGLPNLNVKRSKWIVNCICSRV